jgi:hypothetical protein
MRRVEYVEKVFAAPAAFAVVEQHGDGGEDRQTLCAAQYGKHYAENYQGNYPQEAVFSEEVKEDA